MLQTPRGLRRDGNIFDFLRSPLKHVDLALNMAYASGAGEMGCLPESHFLECDYSPICPRFSRGHRASPRFT
jgi:hypothetical protein